MVEVDRSLPPEAEPWGRYVDQRLDLSERAMGRAEGTHLRVNQAATSTMTKLANDIQRLQSIAASTRYAGVNGEYSGVQGTWFYAGLPSVNVTSPTGKVLVSYGSKPAGQWGKACFRVTGGLLLEPAATPDHWQVTGTGGLAYPRDIHRSVILEVPADVSCTYQLALFQGESPAFGSFRGGYIKVEPIL